MIKNILIVALFFFAAGCGSNTESKEGVEVKAADVTNSDDLSNNPVYKKGLELVSKNDCLTCHKVDQAVNGPAYRDVANKYASYPDTIVQYLASKIIRGGTGTWGSVFMIPHPNLSQEDAEALVKYVLLLKK